MYVCIMILCQLECVEHKIGQKLHISFYQGQIAQQYSEKMIKEHIQLVSWQDNFLSCYNIKNTCKLNSMNNSLLKTLGALILVQNSVLICHIRYLRLGKYIRYYQNIYSGSLIYSLKVSLSVGQICLVNNQYKTMNIRPTIQHEQPGKGQHPQYNKNPAQQQFEDNIKNLQDHPKEYIKHEKLQKQVKEDKKEDRPEEKAQ